MSLTRPTRSPTSSATVGGSPQRPSCPTGGSPTYPARSRHRRPRARVRRGCSQRPTASRPRSRPVLSTASTAKLEPTTPRWLLLRMSHVTSAIHIRARRPWPTASMRCSRSPRASSAQATHPPRPRRPRPKPRRRPSRRLPPARRFPISTRGPLRTPTAATASPPALAPSPPSSLPLAATCTRRATMRSGVTCAAQPPRSRCSDAVWRCR